jgi:hypothetical protein
MGGKSSSPDYGSAAVAQGEANREVIRDQTFANRPTQTTPWGQTTWTPGSTVDPSTGESVTSWEQTTTLDPRLQDILNKQIGIQGGRTDIAGMLTGRMGDEFSEAMDWSNFSPMGTVPGAQLTAPEDVQRSLDFSGVAEVGDPYETRQRAEDAMYNSAMSRLQPQFESEQAALDLKMRNQGLKPGDAAYDAQMQSAQARQTDATNQAMWSSVGEGRAESGQMFDQQMGRRQQGVGEQQAMGNFYNQAAQQGFGQALGANAQNFGQMMQGSQYANQIRQQQIAEAQQQRGQSLNEINALLSGQQVAMPNMPGFNPASAADAAPIYQGAVDQGNYNAATNPWNAVLGTAGSLGGAFLGNPAAFGG